jgi:hypothetical protein
MFYCEKCAQKNGWPDDFYLPQSFGPCEVCETPARCFDVPSHALPAPSAPREK